MLLRDLPRDIHLEILDRLWEDSQAEGCCDMIAVGATCRALRIAALPYIYSELSLGKNTEVLCKFLNDYKHIAAYTRKLTCISSDYLDTPCPFQNLVRNVIFHCTGLQKLDIICPHRERDIDYAARTILEWLPSESRQSLECLVIKTNLTDILQCVQMIANWTANKDFCKLQDLKLDGRFTNPKFLKVTPNEVGSEVLPQVRKLSLLSWALEPEPLGAFFAKMLPNVESLYLEMAPDLAHAILSTYIGLETRIAALEINEFFTPFSFGTTVPTIYPDHLCELIPKLSRRLTKLAISAEVPDHSSFCHRLFKNIDDWPLLVELKLNAARGCKGLEPGLLRSAMTELARTHPEARMLLEQTLHIMVDFKPEGPKYIAPVEVFERLCMSADELYPVASDGDEFDDDHEHDFDLDMEDAMEEYFENYEDEDYEEDDYEDEIFG